MKTLKVIPLIILLSAAAYINLTAQEEPPKPPRVIYDEPIISHFDLEITKEREEAYLKNVDEKLKADLLKIKKADKEKYFKLLMEAGMHYGDLMYASEREKEMVQSSRKISNLEVETQIIAFKYNKAAASDKQKLRTELKNKLDDLFELREKDRKTQIIRLENELDELKASLEVRRKNKEAVINKRLQELLHEDKYLDWE
ncbi:MAG: hypothetical protein A2V66_17320 [Ignavibacteria bacterium RBG_13_36_8]|nr:MAG: hypothetical protein A2V66_17320 [Ignavibacteria bacterium RBG_13_36_8]